MPLTNPLDTMKKGPRFWGRTLLCLTLASCMLLPPVRFAWHEVGYRWAYLLLMGTLLSAGLTPVCLWLALALRTIDLPSPRKVHRTPTPLLGGLAVAGAFGTSLIANGILDRQMVAILNAGVLLVLGGGPGGPGDPEDATDTEGPDDPVIPPSWDRVSLICPSIFR